MLRKKGIVRKTFLFSSLLIVLVIFLSFSVLYFAMPGYYLRQKEQTLKNNLDSLAAELRTAETQEECVSLISGFVDGNNVNVTAFNGEGLLLPEMSSPFVSMQSDEKSNNFYSVIRNSEGDAYSEQITVILKREAAGENPDKEAGKSQRTEQWWITGDSSQDGTMLKMRGYAMRADSSISMRGDVGTEFIDHIMASGTLQPIDEAKGVILSLIPYVLLVAVAIGLLLAWFYARQISKPVLQISDAAVKMRDMKPDAMSGVDSDDELGQLSRNLNDLYSKLRENIESLKAEMERVNLLERSKTEMMQSASHELKTPVAALAGMLNGMLDNVGIYKDRDKYLAECRGQVEKLSWLVREILDASRADNPAQELAQEETAIDVLVEQALDEYGPMIGENGLNVIKNLSPITIMTEPSVLYRALINIVSNAARYTPAGGTIRVDLSDGLLSIENQCEPVPEEELEKLFEPFYTRSLSRDRARSGTGLGLYIVKRNLERLRIPYKLENTENGIKMTLTLR